MDSFKKVNASIENMINETRGFKGKDQPFGNYEVQGIRRSIREIYSKERDYEVRGIQSSKPTMSYCKVCFKFFPVSHMETHAKTHKKQYLCKFCSKSFANYSTLKAH